MKSTFILRKEAENSLFVFFLVSIGWLNTHLNSLWNVLPAYALLSLQWAPLCNHTFFSFFFFFLLKTKRLNVTYLGFSIHWSVCSLSGDFKPPSLLFRVWWKGIQAPKWSSQSRSLTRPLVNGPMLITSISEDHYSFDLLRGGEILHIFK